MLFRSVRHWRCRKKWKTHLKSCCDSCGDCQYAYCCGCLCRVWSMCTCWSGRTGMTGTLWRSSQSGSLNRRKRACGCIGCRSERRNRIGGSPRHYSMMANRRKRKWWYAGCRNVSGFFVLRTVICCQKQNKSHCRACRVWFDAILPLSDRMK